MKKIGLFLCETLFMLIFLLTITYYFPDLIKFTFNYKYFFLFVILLYGGVLLKNNNFEKINLRDDIKFICNKITKSIKIIFDNRKIKIGLIIIIIITGMAIFADSLARYAPGEQMQMKIIEGTFSFGENLPPNQDNWFGTTGDSRDIFSLVVFGLQNTLKLAITASFFSLIFGTILGLLSGYLGGFLEKGINYIVNLVLIMPVLFVILLIKINLGLSSMILVIGLYGAIKTTKLVRAQVLKIKEEEFIIAARALGQEDVGILFKHLLPNLASIIITQGLILVGYNIAIESSLGFMKFSSSTSLGWVIYKSFIDMIIEGNMNFIFPAGTLLLAIVGFTYLGEGFKDNVLQPKGKEV